jgi:chromosome partitioning protein
LAALFLNQAKKGTVLLRESVQILQESGFPVLESVVYDRQCVMDAPGQQVTVWHLKGDSAKRAASEFEQLFQEVMEVLDNYEES